MNETNETIFENDESIDLWAQWQDFYIFWNQVLKVYDPAMSVIMAIGLIGNFMALVTLTRSRNMTTPTFIYHRVLVGTYLAFCINFFALMLVEKFQVKEKDGTGQKVPTSYTNPYLPFFAGILYGVISSVCGYLILYMILLISFDRVVAVVLYKRYYRFNRRKVSITFIAVSITLSMVVHSWAPWAENTIREEVPGRFNFFPRNDSTLRSLRKGKDVYNAVIRLLYPFILGVFTLTSICGFLKRRRFRSRFNSINQQRHTLESMQKEKNLFLLMIAVVILAFIQVLASESRRLLELLYPVSVLSRRVLDTRRSFEERLNYFHILLYGHQTLKIVGNFCTALERSLACYFYLMLNPMFRQEFHSVWCFCWRRTATARQRIVHWEPPRHNNTSRTDQTSNMTHHNGGTAYLPLSQQETQEIDTSGKRPHSEIKPSKQNGHVRTKDIVSENASPLLNPSGDSRNQHTFL